MRSLRIFIQRIFSNIIKQNQNVDSGFVLKQSTTVSSVQNPASKVQHPPSKVQRSKSRVQRPASGVEDPASRVKCPGSGIQSPAYRAQCPTLASKVQEIRYANVAYQQRIRIVFLLNFSNFSLPYPQSGRFWQSLYQQKRLYLLGHFKDEFHFLSIYKSSRQRINKGS